VVVDFAAARLDDEDIFASNRLLNLDTSLSYSKLSEENFSGWYAELIAYRFDQLRMAAAPNNHHIANHGEDEVSHGGELRGVEGWKRILKK